MASESVISAIEALANSPPDELQKDDSARKRLITAARLLAQKLESPWDTVQRLSYVPLEQSTARVGHDLNIFKLLVEHAPQAMTVEELAKTTGAEPLLLERLLRYLASHWMVEEVDENTYKATNITTSLAIPGIRAGIYHAAENCALPYHALPALLSSQAYRNPADPTNTAFQLGHGTSEHLFQWMSSHPANFAAFNEYMGSQRIGRPSWLDTFPIASYLATAASSPSTPQFVDVGGGRGHQCAALLARFPALSGAVVLQDRAPVLAGVDIPGVTPAAHDFTTPQPVVGAAVYYLRNIMQDWPTAACVEILAQIVPAMGPASVVLIDELVLPATGAHWYATSLDLAMMCMVGAHQRSLREWEALLAAAGLRVQTAVPYTDTNDTIVVAVKAEG